MSTSCVVLQNKVAPECLKSSILSEIENKQISQNSAILGLQDSELLVVEGKTLVFTVCEVDQKEASQLVDVIREGEGEDNVECEEDFGIIKEQQNEAQNMTVFDTFLEINKSLKEGKGVKRRISKISAYKITPIEDAEKSGEEKEDEEVDSEFENVHFRTNLLLDADDTCDQCKTRETTAKKQESYKRFKKQEEED